MADDKAIHIHASVPVVGRRRSGARRRRRARAARRDRSHRRSRHELRRRVGIRDAVERQRHRDQRPRSSRAPVSSDRAARAFHGAAADRRGVVRARHREAAVGAADGRSAADAIALASVRRHREPARRRRSGRWAPASDVGARAANALDLRDRHAGKQSARGRPRGKPPQPRGGDRDGDCRDLHLAAGDALGVASARAGRRGGAGAGGWRHVAARRPEATRRDRPARRHVRRDGGFPGRQGRRAARLCRLARAAGRGADGGRHRPAARRAGPDLQGLRRRPAGGLRAGQGGRLRSAAGPVSRPADHRCASPRGIARHRRSHPARTRRRRDRAVPVPPPGRGRGAPLRSPHLAEQSRRGRRAGARRHRAAARRRAHAFPRVGGRLVVGLARLRQHRRNARGAGRPVPRRAVSRRSARTRAHPHGGHCRGGAGEAGDRAAGARSLSRASQQ